MKDTLIPVPTDIFESLMLFVSVDKECRITYINREYALLLGGKPKDFIGRPIYEVVKSSRLPAVLKTGREEYGRYMLALDNENKTINSDFDGTVCNRVLIYKNGDKKKENIIGAMGYTILRIGIDSNKLYRELSAIKSNRLNTRDYPEEPKPNKIVIKRIIGNSAENLFLEKEMIKLIVSGECFTFLSGETGSGKEIVAKEIHDNMAKKFPFVKINCACLIDSDAETTILNNPQLANGGTLYLENAEFLDLNLQRILYDTMQKSRYARGSSNYDETLPYGIIFSSTNSLIELLAERKIYEDFYYVMECYEIKIPALRNHIDDVEAICMHIISRNNSLKNYKITGIDKAALHILKSYIWPGNITEFSKVMDYACDLRESGKITADDIHLRNSNFPKVINKGNAAANFSNEKKRLEAELIKSVLKECGGNKTEAAKKLGITRATIYNRLKE